MAIRETEIGFKMAGTSEGTDTTGKVTTDLIRGQTEVGVTTTSSTDKDNPIMDSMATTPTTQGLVTILTDGTCGYKAQQCYVIS